jgi:hypothetical protein
MRWSLSTSRPATRRSRALPLVCLVALLGGATECRPERAGRHNFLTAYYEASLETLARELGGTYEPRSRSLALEGSQLSVEGLRRLAATPAVRHLVWLSLRGELDPEERRALLERDGPFDSREALLHRAVGDDGVCALAGANSHLDQLLLLRIASVAMTGRGVECLANLRSVGPILTLRENCITGADVAALARAPWAANVRSLSLSNNPVGDEGATLIASSVGLSNLEHLELAHAGVGAVGARALLTSRSLSRLRDLELGSNELGGDALDLLLDRASLPSLRYLQISVPIAPALAVRLAEVRPDLVLSVERDRSTRPPGLCREAQARRSADPTESPTEPQDGR